MEARASVINKRLSTVNRIISVASGKGGVGKSLVASLLAVHLAKQKKRVGLLDLDLYGPSDHIILGISDVFPEEDKGLIPPTVHGVSFMSSVYFTEDKPSPFRGTDITNVIIELLAITQWGNLDYLIIDMPPGIGDETLDVLKYISNSEFLVITTPSKVAMNAVQKLLIILQELDQPILGVIENMTMFASPYIKESLGTFKIPYLGAIAFDERLEDALGNISSLQKTSVMKDLKACLNNVSPKM